MRSFFLWLWLLTKRLYKKPTFLAILVLIPLLVLGYSAAVGEESGMVTIALAGQEDPLTQQIFEDLQLGGQLIRYTLCDSEQQAQLLVQTGKADAAWIFPEELQAHIEDFVKNSYGGFVRVIQREDDVSLMLARERLSGVLYPHIAQSYYLRFVRKNYPELDKIPDEQLLAYYDETALSDELFRYDGADAAKTQQVHYLMSPVRGLLAVVMVLGAMATAMYTVKDRQAGTFRWLPVKYQGLPELGTQVITGLNLGIASLAALLLAGLAGNILRELAAVLVYSLCLASFGMLLRRLLGSIRAIGIVIPLLVVAMLLVCPVFFDLGVMRLFQFLLPPTYYINSVYNPTYLVWGMGYSLVCLLLCAGLGSIKLTCRD